MMSEHSEHNERNEQGEPITRRGVEGIQGYRQDRFRSSETSAYCIGYTDPSLYAEALARVGGGTTAVEPDEAWETEDAVSFTEAEQLALERWRDLGVPTQVPPP